MEYVIQITFYLCSVIVGKVSAYLVEIRVKTLLYASYCHSIAIMQWAFSASWCYFICIRGNEAVHKKKKKLHPNPLIY